MGFSDPPLPPFGSRRTAFLTNTAGPQYCSRACADEEDGTMTMIGLYVGEVYCGLPGCWEKALRCVPWRSLHFCCEAHRVLQVSKKKGMVRGLGDQIVPPHPHFFRLR